jgi:hypothetical protein
MESVGATLSQFPDNLRSHSLLDLGLAFSDSLSSPSAAPRSGRISKLGGLAL